MRSLWATHGPFICLNTLALPQSVLYHAGHPKERKSHMDDITSEAQTAAAAIIEENGTPKSHDALQAMLAYAYAQGARAGMTEAVESFDRVLAKHSKGA